MMNTSGDHVNTTYPPLGDLPGDIMAGEIFLIILSILTTLPGILACLLQLIYLISSRGHSLVSTLFLSVCTVDLVILITHLPVTASLMSSRSALLFSSALFCKVWGVVWYTASRLSVVLIALLSITRSLCLVRPFSQPLKSRNMIMVILAALTLLLIIYGAPVLFGGTYEFASTACLPMPANFGPISDSIYPCFLLLPFLVITISCGVSVGAIRFSHNNSTTDTQKQGATTTIILLTTLYLVCNVPQIMYLSGFVIQQAGLSTTSLSDFLFVYLDPVSDSHVYAHLFVFAVNVSVPVNSTANSLLWIYRSRGMRAWLWKLIGRSAAGGRIVRNESRT
eukprot:sb/3466508/